MDQFSDGKFAEMQAGVRCDGKPTIAQYFSVKSSTETVLAVISKEPSARDTGLNDLDLRVVTGYSRQSAIRRE